MISREQEQIANAEFKARLLRPIVDMIIRQADQLTLQSKVQPFANQPQGPLKIVTLDGAHQALSNLKIQIEKWCQEPGSGPPVPPEEQKGTANLTINIKLTGPHMLARQDIGNAIIQAANRFIEKGEYRVPINDEQGWEVGYMELQVRTPNPVPNPSSLH